MKKTITSELSEEVKIMKFHQTEITGDFGGPTLQLGSLIYQPKQSTKGKSLKITIHLHCFIFMANLMIKTQI